MVINFTSHITKACTARHVVMRYDLGATYASYRSKLNKIFEVERDLDLVDLWYARET